jgi:glutaconate CoA-transferase subunit B
VAFLGGSIEKPERRFAGSGGGNQVASHCWKTIIIIKHEGRRFVPKLDFLTSPGYLDGPGARERAGLPRGTGPHRVVTSKALFGFDEETRRMTLLSVLRGIPVEEVLADMAFRPLLAKEIVEIEPPTTGELRVLREEIDPGRFIIRGERMTATI